MHPTVRNCTEILGKPWSKPPNQCQRSKSFNPNNFSGPTPPTSTQIEANVNPFRGQDEKFRKTFFAKSAPKSFLWKSLINYHVPNQELSTQPKTPQRQQTSTKFTSLNLGCKTAPEKTIMPPFRRMKKTLQKWHHKFPPRHKA